MASVGDEVYFILYDRVDERSKDGWLVSSPHEVIDMCEQGFFTGDRDEFPNNADFTRWENVGADAFFDEGEAEEMVDRLAEKMLSEEEGYEAMRVRATRVQGKKTCMTRLIERDMPMKPGEPELGASGGEVILCGNCGEGIEVVWEFCPWCGQRTGW